MLPEEADKVEGVSIIRRSMLMEEDVRMSHRRLKGQWYRPWHKTPPDHVRRGGTNQTRADDKNSPKRDQKAGHAAGTGEALH